MSISLSISVSIISISTSIVSLHLHPFFPRMDIISLWLTAIYYFSLIINLNLKRKKPWHQTSLPWIKISLRGCHFLISAMKQIYAGMALLWLVRCRECSGDNSTAQGSLCHSKSSLEKLPSEWESCPGLGSHSWISLPHTSWNPWLYKFILRILGYFRTDTRFSGRIILHRAEDDWAPALMKVCSSFQHK